MKKLKGKTQIKGGYLHDRKGNQFITLQDAMANDTNCGCGINCRLGYVSLPNYNSESGDVDGFSGFFIKDGELVVNTATNIRNELNNFCNGAGDGGPKALLLTFTSIENANEIVGDASNVENWNTFFDLPTLGGPFTSVEIIGNTVYLFGGSNIKIRPGLMYDYSYTDYLVAIDDQADCVTSVGGEAFSYSFGLTDVRLPACTIVYGYQDSPYGDYGGFGFCPTLVNVSIPLLETAGDWAFAECGSLVTLNFPILTSAGEYCFYYCYDLETISAPNLVTAGNNCFSDCESLVSVNFPNLVTAGDNCFDSCTYLVSVNLPSLTTAGDNCFDYCTALTTTNLSSLVDIGSNCFYRCTSLATITLPVLTITGNYGFWDCTSLTSVSLPNATTVGNFTFYECTALTSISLPSCTNLGSTVGDNDVFNNIGGNTITLTVPAALMTADSGSPDGDIAYLQANNSVTVVTV